MKIKEKVLREWLAIIKRYLINAENELEEKLYFDFSGEDVCDFIRGEINAYSRIKRELEMDIEELRDKK